MPMTSRARRNRGDEAVSKCIAKERRKGRPADQSAAICYSKKRKGTLGPRGGKKK